jgi:hypothetical protein
MTYYLHLLLVLVSANPTCYSYIPQPEMSSLDCGDGLRMQPQLGNLAKANSNSFSPFP